jgi:uncharacterized membrane protein
MNIEPMIAANFISALQQFVSETKLHPILVNFTAALVPLSVAADAVGRWRKDESLLNTGWWTLFCATAITPFTALAGWLFWMPDDNGVTGMTIHKWLGTSLAVLLFGLFAWRLKIHRQKQWATIPYFITGAIFIVALVYQGYLGGQQVFSGM